MFFLSLISHLLCAWFAFLLPSYSTYKALAHSHSSDALQTLAMYWAVIGAFITFEQTIGPFISWFPFHWELRTLFLLYLSLPQTQGSTYVYKTYFEPWCSKNEAEIDTSIASAQSNILTFCSSRISSLIDLLWNCLTGATVNGQFPANGEASRPGAVPLDQLKSLWAAHGPSVLAAFAPKDASFANHAQVNSDTQKAEL